MVGQQEKVATRPYIRRIGDVRRFGPLLNSLLQERGLSQNQFAKRVKVRQTTLSAYIRSKNPPKKGIGPKLGKALGLGGKPLQEFEQIAERERFYFKKDVGPIFFEIEQQLKETEKLAVSLGRKLVDHGIELSQDLTDALRSIEKELGE